MKTSLLKSLALVVVISTTSGAAALAQEAAQAGHADHSLGQMIGLSHDHVHLHGDPNDHRWCGTDMGSPEVLEQLQIIRRDRELGRYPLQRAAKQDPEIGERQQFNVNESGWAPLEFELVDKTSLYYLWVEVDELTNGNVTPGEITQLKEVIHDSSPARSINPNQGLFANNHDVFGLPPNVDGDGIVDILMYDIGRGSGSTLGYVSATDQLLDPPGGQGNQRDVLYLDSNEGTRNLSTLAVIAVHEYTHLIHLTYGWDTSFVTEGYAEYSMVMNGYYWRGVGFTGSIFEVGQPLFTWRTNPNGGPGARDYERGGLFFTYIAEQVGHQAVGDMLKDTEKKGASGIDSVLVNYGSTLSDMLMDYHTANYINDKSIDPRFGYNEPERSSHNTFLSAPAINGELTSSSGEGGHTLQFAETVNPGAVYHLRLNNVANLAFSYDTPDPTGLFRAEKLERNRARLLIQEQDGPFSLMDIEPGQGQIVLSDNYESITFILVHERPEIAIGDINSISAGWTPLSKATDTEALTIPEAFQISSVYPNPFQGSTSVDIQLDRPGTVQIDLVDTMGRRARSIASQLMAAGPHHFRIDASDLASGTYLLRISVDGQIESRMLTVLR